MNAIKDIEGAKLFSIDKSIIWYRNRKKKTGYFVQEKFPELVPYIQITREMTNYKSHKYFSSFK